MPDTTVIIVGLIVMAWIGDWATKRAERRAAVLDIVAASPHAPLPDAAQTFLSTLDGHLNLPDDARREIELELRDHFEDSIAGLEAEGLDRDRAAREAMARLGRPEELARQLGIAHRSNRRLLAGAAGGVFSAAGGVLFGFVLGYALVMLGLLAGALVISLTIARYLPAMDGNQLAFGTVFASVIAYVPAFLAARRAVAASAAISERDPKTLSIGWAVAGGLGVAGLILFLVTSQQSWPAVPFELGIAGAFIAGALFRPTIRVPQLPLGRAFGLFVVAMAITIGLGTIAVSAGGGTSSDGPVIQTSPDQQFSHIAPSTTAPSRIGFGNWWPEKGGRVDFDVESPAAFAGWSDLRFEAWRAVYPNSDPHHVLGAVDTRYPSPYATQPIPSVSKKITATFDLSRVRTNLWLVVVTGAAPDGHRYLLTGELPAIESRFSGTVWDWLTAPD